MGNAIYINDENDIRFNEISTHFMNHKNHKLRTKRITPNFIIGFIFTKIKKPTDLIKLIEKELVK